MGTEKITMPQLGESVTEGTINSWLVKEGDYVNKYDPIADVMTDKVNAEVPSSYEGTIKEILTPEGTTIKVGEIMCYIETKDSSSEPVSMEQGSEPVPEKNDAIEEKVATDQRSEERRVGKTTKETKKTREEEKQPQRETSNRCRQR